MPGTDERTFDLLVDDVPYFVKVEPFSFDGEVRFYINVNGSSDHVFTWDSKLGTVKSY